MSVTVPAQMEGQHDTMTTGEATLARTRDATFLCHPMGLFYLAFTEAWERFSYYGMTALVVLYMVNQLLLPGHVQHIFGFSGFKAAVESVVARFQPRRWRRRFSGSTPVSFTSRRCSAA